MTYEIFLRWLHVLGASTLLGTGAGIAFFMLMAHRSGDVKLIAHTNAIVVIADTIFTTTAVIIQPITGVLLALHIGWSLLEPWLALSIALYIFTGFCWLPVVWIQIKLRDMAKEAVMAGRGLPVRYDRLFKIWFVLGFPAFFAVLSIIWLMLARPSFA